MTSQNPITQGAVPQQMAVHRKSWLGRNWKWLLLVVFSMLIVLGLGIFALIMSAMRSSTAAEDAVARAQSNPAVVERLGSGIAEGWIMSGSINVSADGSGDADLAVPISGPKGKATVYVTGRKSGGTWNYTQMQAAIDGSGERINLLATSAPVQLGAAPTTATSSPAPSPAPETGAPLSASAAAATTQATSSSEGLGSGDGEQAGTKVVVTDLKRGGSTVTLKFTMVNDSNTPLSTGMRFKSDGYKENGGRSFSGIHLIDAIANKKYFVVADSDGNCECSEHVDDIAPKTQVSLWAKFPAPPDNTQKITVEIPHFIPIEDVPIR